MWDDYRKLVLKDSRGLAARWKYLWQSLFGFAAAVALYSGATLPVETQLLFPFMKDLVLELGPFFILFGYLVIVGSSNAVNLTDGLTAWLSADGAGVRRAGCIRPCLRTCADRRVPVDSAPAGRR